MSYKYFPLAIKDYCPNNYYQCRQGR